MPIAELDNVGKRYGTLEALNGVALQIERGELLALLGPNGRKQDLPRSTFTSDSAVALFQFAAACRRRALVDSVQVSAGGDDHRAVIGCGKGFGPYLGRELWITMRSSRSTA